MPNLQWHSWVAQCRARREDEIKWEVAFVEGPNDFSYNCNSFTAPLIYYKILKCKVYMDRLCKIIIIAPTF